jgi:hypothetical protein
MNYLCTPYSPHSRFKSAEDRYQFRENAYALARDLQLWFNFQLNEPTISPIVLWHPTAVKYELGTEAKHFENFNRHLLSLCNECIVPKVGGISISKGVAQEIEWAEAYGIKVTYLDDVPFEIKSRWENVAQYHWETGTRTWEEMRFDGMELKPEPRIYFS